MLVTVSGPPGSGKSTAAAGLATAFELDHISGGDIFRQLAAERDMTLAEFGELAESDPEIDRNLDRRLRSIATDRDDIVLESRLAGWLAGEAADLRFWLDASLGVRAARIAEREGISFERAKELTADREASEQRRYQEYYGIDFWDRGIYDLSINTGRWSETAEIDLLIAAVDAYDPSADEGPMPLGEIDLPEP